MLLSDCVIPTRQESGKAGCFFVLLSIFRKFMSGPSQVHFNLISEKFQKIPEIKSEFS